MPEFHLASGESVELRELLSGTPRRWFSGPQCDDCAAVRSALVGLLVPYAPAK